MGAWLAQAPSRRWRCGARTWGCVNPTQVCVNRVLRCVLTLLRCVLTPHYSGGRRGSRGRRGVRVRLARRAHQPVRPARQHHTLLTHRAHVGAGPLTHVRVRLARRAHQPVRPARQHHTLLTHRAHVGAGPSTPRLGRCPLRNVNLVHHSAAELRCHACVYRGATALLTGVHTPRRLQEVLLWLRFSAKRSSKFGISCHSSEA